MKATELVTHDIFTMICVGEADADGLVNEEDVRVLVPSLLMKLGFAGRVRYATRT